ncbi:uncharacterized protein DUF4102 [Nitrosospira sp. Nsp2]|uniref:tyrosine-type recombinase/integrase n=1 Tax=Nitrosospira sp. Nsp2 TaxID=136548 RepID=UPI000D4D8B01|nr:integrase arm-type DNA-binding domain-containing protein [Nitrosospira sp. Nsp2]PTR16500.1 uncharacterized protein DUF4102 [Nitrosospira sp. Nsp2]
MSLTNTAILNAKPGLKPFKLVDERGLFLLVTPSGGRWWRFRYKSDGKEKLLSLGIYPDILLASRTLKDEETGKTRKIKGARELRNKARELLAQGVDPDEDRKAQKATKQTRAAHSFEVVARERYAKYGSSWSQAHGERIIRRFERDVFPWIGGHPVSDVASSDLLSVIRRIESRGAIEAADRALAN